MTIIIATIAATTACVLLAVAYILMEMGYLTPTVQDFEEDYSEAVDEVLALNTRIAELEAEVKALQAANVSFEDWVDSSLTTQDLFAGKLLSVRASVQDQVETIKTHQLVIGMNGIHFQPMLAAVEEEAEAVKSYVAYPIEDCTDNVTVVAKRVNSPQ